MPTTQAKRPMRICVCRLAEYNALGNSMPQQAQSMMLSSLGGLPPAPVPHTTLELGQSKIGASAAPSQPQPASGSSHDLTGPAPKPDQPSNGVAEPYRMKSYEHIGQHSQADDAGSTKEDSQIGEAAAGLAAMKEGSQLKPAVAGGATPRVETRPYATELSLQVCIALCHLP